MSFASTAFLWWFMPFVLVAYWIAPRTRRNAVLAVASLVFYAYGAHRFVLLLVLCIAVNYVLGLVLGRPSLTTVQQRLALAGAVTFNVAVLGYWKYSGFLAAQSGSLDRAFGGHLDVSTSVALPLGISFFTFHHLSYVIDVSRGTRPPSRRPIDFVTYIAMFPQLVAGPIVRFHEIDDQLRSTPGDRYADFIAGFPRFALGLAKKVIVADTIAPVTNSVFALPAGQSTTASAWLGMVAYTLQIYFDFSGYSDIAIGLGRMFGFRLPENFDRPYSAVSVTDFWRRWHMSLSRWFRDYLYIPLGGNRSGSLRTYRNLLIVFFLAGLWHGANWTFVVWGLYHGTLLIVERGRPHRVPHTPTARSLRAGALRARTLLLVMVGWVLFRAPNLHYAFSQLEHLVAPHGLSLNFPVSQALTHQRVLVLALAALVVLVPRHLVLGPIVADGTSAAARRVRLALVLVAAPYAAMLVSSGSFSPFLYYQF